MNPVARERSFGFDHAFDHPVSLWTTVAVAGILILTPLIVLILDRSGTLKAGTRAELMRRTSSWAILIPLILVPILLGAAYTIVAIGILSLLCYREFARATGLFRERVISAVVAVGIVAITFANLDNWYRLFMALSPLTFGVIAIVAILKDQPQGYIQRVALGFLGFGLFGSCLGHLGFLANDAHYRPMLILVVLAVELNDVFAYIVGKTLGRRKLIPNTSPNKTVAGSVGALTLTTLLVLALGSFVFAGTELGRPWRLVTLGMLISILGQFGDLMLSSIKRDLGIKDMAATIPGHGGFLDRFDSMILVAPAYVSIIDYVIGVGMDQPTNLWTGG